jgi:hypothetical protein
MPSNEHNSGATKMDVNSDLPPGAGSVWLGRRKALGEAREDHAERQHGVDKIEREHVGRRPFERTGDRRIGAELRQTIWAMPIGVTTAFTLQRYLAMAERSSGAS